MILYYSGTGNTKYVALSLSDLIGEEAHFIPHVDPKSIHFSGKILLFCFPVYSWGVPPFVINFLNRLSSSFVVKVKDENIPVILVCTAGDEVALTPQIFKNALNEIELTLSGVWSVIMPNDYVMLPGFDVDSREVENKKLTAAKSRIIDIARKITAGKWDFDVVKGKWAGLKSKLIYPAFVKWGVTPAWWHVSDSCISCGRCQRVCPVGNISFESGKPSWGKNCLSCTACYQICPVNAISYSSFTKGKGQYFCEMTPLSKNDLE